MPVETHCTLWILHWPCSQICPCVCACKVTSLQQEPHATVHVHTMSIRMSHVISEHQLCLQQRPHNAQMTWATQYSNGLRNSTLKECLFCKCMSACSLHCTKLAQWCKFCKRVLLSWHYDKPVWNWVGLDHALHRQTAKDTLSDGSRLNNLMLTAPAQLQHQVSGLLGTVVNCLNSVS